MMRLDNNRIVRPFAWGLDYLNVKDQAGSPKEILSRYAHRACKDSNMFYALPEVPDYSLNGNQLTYPSAIQNPHKENNTVYGHYFPHDKAKSAVVLLPQWNADRRAHMSLGRLLNRIGIAALRLSLPYHDSRRPPELERADYLVDANIGRTIQACRQAVLDTRLAVEWLYQRGFQRVGLVGTSIGACIAALTTAHEHRIKTVVYNLASGYFADVVWKGLTTQHVRRGLDGHVSLEELRHYWSMISPFPFVKRMRDEARKIFIISARYDPTFLPSLTQNFFDEHNRQGVPIEKAMLPCGHYTLAKFPFNWIDGFLIVRFLRHAL